METRDKAEPQTLRPLVAGACVAAVAVTVWVLVTADSGERVSRVSVAPAERRVVFARGDGAPAPSVPPKDGAPSGPARVPAAPAARMQVESPAPVPRHPGSGSVRESAVRDGVSDAEWAGLSGHAIGVKVGDRKIVLNEIAPGEYARVQVPVSSRVEIRASYPGSPGGEEVVARMLDGGSIADGGTVLAVKTDGRGMVGFEARVDAEEGLYQIALRKDGTDRIVPLWVGAPPVYRR